MNTDSVNRFAGLDRRFLLRGWQGMPYALLDDITGQVCIVPEAVFRTMQLCNGQYREYDPVFFGPRRKILEELEKKKLIVFSDEPFKLRPEQAYRSYPNHFIRKVHWSVTGRCNYRCRHCYMSAPHAVLPQPGTQEMFRIADEIADCGIPVVTLTGGEPLIREDFLSIVERLVSRGVRISTIMTNGALVTEELLDELEKRGVLCGFDISFDGVDGWHDWMRGVPGAGENAIRALRLCHEHGFETGVQIVLHKGNLSVLRESVRMLSELGVSGAVVGGVRDVGEGHALGPYILSDEELFEAYAEYLPQFVEDGMPLSRVRFSGMFAYENGKFVLPLVRGDVEDTCSRALLCPSMRNTMYLSPDGYVLPCIPMSYNEVSKQCFPNVSELTLSEALGDSAYMRFISSTAKDYFEHNPECRACAYAKQCSGGCRGRATEASHGENLMGKDPFTCWYFLDGYYDRAREIIERLQKKVNKYRT
jgi:radical SAM protein with 4Fe4S-binding SPASM domain